MCAIRGCCIGRPASSEVKIVSSVDWRALENLVTKGVRKGIQNRGASAADRRLTDTAGADRESLGAGGSNARPIACSPEHPRIVGGFIVVEPLGNHLTVVRVEDPLLADRVADAERRPAENLPAERTRVDHRCPHRRMQGSRRCEYPPVSTSTSISAKLAASKIRHARRARNYPSRPPPGPDPPAQPPTPWSLCGHRLATLFSSYLPPSSMAR